MNKTLKRLPLAVAILSALGTQSAVAQVSQDESSVVLDTIHATLDRQGAKVKTNVVTLQEKDKSTETDLRGLLKEEPAIDFGGGNGTSQYIAIRGMGQNSVDVKIDGAYTDSQILYHQSRHMLDPSMVKIVSVQKGAGSASAGIGGTNGAIIAKTLSADDLLKNGQNIGFRVGAGYSSNDEHSYNAAAYGKLDNVDFLLSANKVDQDDYTAGKDKKIAFTALDKTSYLAKVGANFGNHRFELSHLSQENKGVRPIREEFINFNTESQDPQYRKVKTENTNLQWNAKNLGVVSGVDANVYHIVNSRYTTDDSKAGYAGKLAGSSKSRIDTKGLNINLDSQVNDDVLLKYGVNYRQQEITPNRYKAGIVNQEKTDTGVYVEAIADIGKLTATAGLRYDHFDIKDMTGGRVKGDNLNPSVGLIYQATPSLSFSANHSYATRSPRLYDALTAHGYRAVVKVTDSLKAEKAQNTEIGFNFNQGNAFVNGSYYWQSINNLLKSASNGSKHENGTSIDEMKNVGYAKNKGYELNAGYKWQGLTARVGISDSKPEFYSSQNFSNREYASRLGRTWTAALSYRFAQPNLEVGVRHRRADDVIGDSAWTGKVVSTDPRKNHDPKKLRPGYNTTDVFANWKPLGNDKVNVNMSVNNITDEYYTSHISSSGVALPAVGREYRIGVNFTY
ncbi:TonB-dependent receptor [Moraxella haemolytica]|uniref:TonB-dependent receptor domain-containing protein n=1 Tax=Moraxella haemolytica TaxID=2904119 RepID=UPI002543C65B|nr:TonB-dependent receptor [Moraxella sp. ZY171148]WII95605.1 TonB-dependent receptor [Moraxella sp. ZY171148]